MVIDTSALLAILLDEPERHKFNESIQAADVRLLSVASFVEASIVLDTRLGPNGVRALDLFVSKAGIEAVPVDVEQGELARRAYQRFGQRRHRANLNYGDCFAYALVQQRADTLLYKGDDFCHTDIVAAV